MHGGATWCSASSPAPRSYRLDQQDWGWEDAEGPKELDDVIFAVVKNSYESLVSLCTRLLCPPGRTEAAFCAPLPTMLSEVEGAVMALSVPAACQKENA